MSRITHLSTCSVFALSLASGPALAELSAAEVWESLEGMMQSFGYDVSATETPTGNGLDVTGLTMAVVVPEENTEVTMTMDAISFVENGDGTVSVVFPESMPIAIAAAPEGEDDVSLVLDYTHSGLDMVVSGDPANMSYTFSADTLGMALSDLIVNDTLVGPDMARAEFTLSGVAGTSATVEAGDWSISQDMTAEGVTYDMAFTDPESDSTAFFKGSMDSLAITSAATLPEGFDANDPQSIAEGFSTDVTFSYANGQMEFAATDDDETVSGTTSAGLVNFGVALTSEDMRYDVEATDQAFAIAGAEIPVPVNVSMARSAFNISAPLAVADTPQDVAFGITFGGFEMSELLWNMFDPGAALPRDPATIALDLTGKITPFVNMLDPASMAQLEATGGIPGELNSLTLNDLTVEAAGAKLGGTGSFTFDNDDLQTFGGFPRPSGGVDLTVDGANGLIDKLIAMGLLTSDDAMGARMMMSMFAVPGDGPDNLTSSIQINDQGHVLANGMRIQ